MPISSLLLNNKNVEVIPTGTMIVIDAGEARAYDSEDSLDDVVGVASAISDISGREWGPFYTGSECYLNDSVVWNEDLTYTSTENTEYLPFNPYSDTDKFTIVNYSGFAAVLSSYTELPSRWQIIRSGTTYNWIFIR
jgi:hypothetical protein